MFNVGLRMSGIGKHRSAAPAGAQYAAAAGTVLSLTISVGDTVIVFTQSNNSPSSGTDDGVGGSNTYTHLTGYQWAGYGDAWYCDSAAHVAATVTMNGSGAPYQNICGASIPTAIGHGANGATGASNTISITTTANGSKVLGCIQQAVGGGWTVNHGTEVARSVYTDSGQCILLETDVPSSGTSTQSQATGGSFNNALAVEVKM